MTAVHAVEVADHHHGSLGRIAHGRQLISLGSIPQDGDRYGVVAIGPIEG